MTQWEHQWKYGGSRLIQDASRRMACPDNVGDAGCWFWLHLPHFELKDIAEVIVKFLGSGQDYKMDVEWDLIEMNKTECYSVIKGTR